MLEEIKKAFRNQPFLTPKDIFQMASIAGLRKIKAGEHFLQAGDMNYKAVIVLSGLLAHYVWDKDGNEHILLFVPEGMNTGALQTAINDKPADENIIALEDSILLTFDRREMEKLAHDNTRLLRMIIERQKLVISQAAERIKFLTLFSPEERYNYFNTTYPRLESRVKLKHLASFLCITPQSLSRIRSRIAQS